MLDATEEEDVASALMLHPEGLAAEISCLWIFGCRMNRVGGEWKREVLDSKLITS